MRRWDYFAAILLISLVLNSLFTGGERRAPIAESPRRPPPAAVAPAPVPAPVPQAPSPGLPVSRVEHKVKTRSAAGTAFAVDGIGTWLTARHVIDGCDRVGIIYDHKTRRAQRAAVRAVHANADVAVLSGRVPGGTRPVALAAVLDGETEAFHVGYPKGRRAVLHSSYLGRWRLTGFGRFRNDEEVAVWGVISRYPEDLPGFGGISGGPVFSADGRVIGISVAGSDRRGRAFHGRRFPRGRRTPARRPARGAGVLRGQEAAGNGRVGRTYIGTPADFRARSHFPASSVPNTLSSS